MEGSDRADEAEGAAPEAESAMETRDVNTRAQEGRGARGKKKKPWERQAHGARGASKRKQAAARQEKRAARDEVVSAAFERDSRTYGEAMRSSSRAEWQTAMKEEIAALN